MSNKTFIELSPITSHKIRRASADNASDQTSPIRPILRHALSHNSLRKHPTSPPIPTIIEDENNELKKPSRKTSTATTKGSASVIQPLNACDLNFKHKTSSAYITTGITQVSIVNEMNIRGSGRSQTSVNQEYQSNSNNPADAMSYQSRYSSNQSLSTYKEQYCCSPNCRFTPRERRLCTSVAVLATVIVILVVVIGVLAEQKGIEQKFFWSL